MTTRHIGYYGLGGAGHDLARRLAAAQPILAADAGAPDPANHADTGIDIVTPAALFARCEVIFLHLDGETSADALLLGDTGLLRDAPDLTTLVLQSAADPAEVAALAAQLAQRQIALIDAPLLGLPGARPGPGATIVCGGDADAVARITPLLGQMAARVIPCGGSGAGQAARLVDIASFAANWVVTQECVGAGLAHGLQPGDMARVFAKSSGRNSASERAFALISDTGAAEVPLGAMRRDFDAVVAAATATGAPMMLAHMATAMLRSDINLFGDDAAIDRIHRIAGAIAQAGR